ncbi:MAG: efflux RND transporter permease subunit [Candidatus Cloacimonetes bacterium]|nr:efflux RND transporter permease subunit [Candidatus Cloacimonadota bacterium]
MSIAKFSVNNSVLINMAMIVVFIVGISVMKSIPKEEMPPVDFGSFIVGVVYPGVSPLEMETLVLNKIEEEIADVENLDFMTSTASEGRAIIFLQFLPDADIDKAWNDFNAELDKVRDLPDDAGDPWTLRLSMREVNPMCTIVLSGDFDANQIREIADDLKENVLDIENVSKVSTRGTRERELWIEADATRLNEFGLTLSDLERVIQMRNMNVPGGTIDFGRKEFILRTVGEFEETEEVARLIVSMDGNGRAIRLEDVATVTDTLENAEWYSKYNIEPAVLMDTYKKSEGNIIKVMEDMRAEIAVFQESIPGLSVTIVNDGSTEVKSSLSVLGRSALIGILLVFVTLTLLLGWRNAILASMGIPFSFLLTFILMRYFDISMNTLSLFGLVLVLGMIVDDAIIVIENVYRYIEEGLPPKEAAVRGTQEIMWPVIAAVTTTAVAFLPMLMMEGMMGKFMRVFPIVVSLALLASLFESLVILPSHTADFARARRGKHDGKVRKNALAQALVRRYQRVLRVTLKHRFLTMLTIFLMMALAVGALRFRLVQFEFFPQQTPKTIMLKIQTPMGTNLDETNAVVTSVEEHILSMTTSTDVEAVVTTVGGMGVNRRWEQATNNAQVRIDLKDDDFMQFSHNELKNEVREFMDQLPGIYKYRFQQRQDGPPTGEDIEIRVKGDNIERLEYIGSLIQDKLKEIPGVADVKDDFMPGKDEVRIVPNHDRLGLHGLSVAEVAGVVRTASYGSTVSTFRGFGTDEYDIIVRLKQDQVDELDELGDLKIRTRAGNLIALRELADFEITQSLAQINHRDQKRIITITGANTFYTDDNGVERKRTSDEVTTILFGNRLRGITGTISGLEQRFLGYQIESGGVAEEQAKSYGSLFRAYAVALLLIFTILAAQFRSYVQPLIVMMTIPFAFIGVIFGLLVTGLPFSLTTLVAVVALAGVVVNDSLILVDFVNRERERGVNRWVSLINAGSTRLRPILLTTITTIFGVMPMILSSSRSAAEWKPMAVSMAFGLGFATLLTLFVIPVIYSLVDSFFGKLRITRFKGHLSFEEAMAGFEAEETEKDNGLE